MLPDRYRLEVRLGRDGDSEEWLGYDTVLDRPVLVRMLGAEADTERRQTFLTGTRQAAAIPHPHLAAVYAAEAEPTCYAVCEWNGGMTLADRLRSGESLTPGEFLANAGGLADALAVLHEAGYVHGAIDAGAVSFSARRTAKLGAFGRIRRTEDPSADVADLAGLLEQALTGLPPGSADPSEVVDGLPPEVDQALARGRLGEATARSLAETLWAIPIPATAEEPEEWSGRVMAIAMVLVVAAGLVIGLGLLLGGVGQSRGSAISTSPTTTLAPSEPMVEIVAASTFDPFGDNGTENESRVGAVFDGDLASSWRTERYLDPLPQLKAGVGLVFEVRGSPISLEMVGVSEGTAYQVGWTATRPVAAPDWETVAGGVAQGGEIDHQLPPRRDGFWVIWLTDLPFAGEDDYSATIAELRFRP